ncbi:hypothetical protein ACFQZZ_24020 [Nocardia sp. GCM10030253]|uniref:hypothetical protein n=1 Tax=Nocardia sp. GCM10030253 TaxID=3273404 RepID=UPI00362607BB
MIKSRGRELGGCVVIVACALLTGCGGDDQHEGHSATDSRQPGTATSALPQSNSLTSSAVPAPAANVPIGEVPGNANAAAALQPWARDLVGGDIDQLVRKCWTIDPKNARDMYADKDGILAAIAQPGLDGQFAIIWKGPTETVSVKRSEIASGYACPRVAPTGSESSLNEGDARYTVRRYLSRWVGQPVNPDDTEGKYPLVCPGSVLAANPGRLTGTTAFADSEMTSSPTGISDVEVSVPVTNSSGVTKPTVFMLPIGPDGYCITDISG